MMGLKNSDYSKLLHDIRRLGDAIQIITEEPIEKRRKIVADLLRAELDRLYIDIEEMREPENDS